jgi:CheY-like chemotaxis protein
VVVDDDSAVCALVSEVLEEEGYDVAAAANGWAALDLLARWRREGQPPPDLLLLDIRMPAMDGWEFLHAYRRTPPPRAAVVALTASHNAAADAALNGLAGALIKPFAIEELIAVAARHTCGAGAAGRRALAMAAGPA